MIGLSNGRYYGKDIGLLRMRRTRLSALSLWKEALRSTP